MASAASFSKLDRPMPPLAYFGIESSGLNLAVDLVFLFVAVLYLSLIYWTYADARRRIEDPIMVGLATVASVFPFVGAVVYVILRPPEYLDDVHERELETQAAEARLHQLDQTLCPHCDYRIEPDFVRCPSCLRKLKERCVNCNRPLDQAWTICPYCEADVPGLSSSRPRRRRPATKAEGEEIELERPLRGEDLETETAAPVAASEPAPRTRASGRSTRPGGRARPTS
jgi:Double zinc ribbon